MIDNKSLPQYKWSAVMFIIASAVVAFPRFAVSAADPLVPPEVRAALTLRILEYDRGLKAWAGASLTVGIVAKNGSDPDTAEYGKALEGRSAQDLPLRVARHVYRDESTMAKWIKQEDVRLLYLSSDFGGTAQTVLSLGNTLKLPSLTATRKHFKAGATMGIVVLENKPHILVNLDLSKTAGMNLDPKLLQLAEVVR
jgi:hypothetical protein